MDDKLVGKIATNNGGNMSKQEALDFFIGVVDDLKLRDFTMEFTSAAPSTCLSNKILFYEGHLNAYPWQIKEEILHELAHHYSRGVTGHSEKFYEAYIGLLNKYACNNEIGYCNLSDPSIIEKGRQAEKQAISGLFRSDGRLQSLIRGAIIDTYNQHGEINKSNADSAARRATKQIWGAIKSTQLSKKVE